MLTGSFIIIFGMIALIVTSYGAGRELKDLLIVWVFGLLAIALLREMNPKMGFVFFLSQIGVQALLVYMTLCLMNLNA